MGTETGRRKVGKGHRQRGERTLGAGARTEATAKRAGVLPSGDTGPVTRFHHVPPDPQRVRIPIKTVLLPPQATPVKAMSPHTDQGRSRWSC